MPLYLGIDMGTSSIKASLMDGEGTVLLRLERQSSMLHPGPGLCEVDAEGVWWKSVCSICQDVCSRYPASSVRALCVSSVCGSFVPVDAKFRPVHNAVLYGIDRRSEALLGPLNERYGEDFLRERLGGLFSTHAILPKILWFKREMPEVYAAASHFVSSFNFIGARLTGVASWDYPTAYGALMLDGETEGVPAWFLEDQGLDPGKIPPAGCALEPLGRVTDEAGRETGLAPGTIVMRGACDINAEAMAVGAVMPGSAVAVFGSTVSLLLNTETPQAMAGFMAGRSLVPGVWRLGAATASGGRTVNWSRNVYGRTDAPASGPDLSDGPGEVYFIPYLEGARAPFNNPAARGAFLGLSAAHGPADMARAVYEALGYELALIIARMERAAPFPDILDVSGGLIRTPNLARLVADSTGKILRLHPDVDASCGDARIAMLADRPLGELPFPSQNALLCQPSPASPAFREHAERFAAYCEWAAAEPGAVSKSGFLRSAKETTP